MGFIDAFIHCWHYFCQVRSGNTDKLNIISFQQNQQHKINLSTQLIFDRILTKTVVQLKGSVPNHDICSQKINKLQNEVERLEEVIKEERMMVKVARMSDDCTMHGIRAKYLK
ncbi:Hypothetical_protein [Hexamita inflata]|uniref:Hypothetical_protein n=1 Tax=Hexamita inflata TaxID=28002 RepID=A0AA86NFE0_9EUKA|nr:Hypothetical protein HINF_LOCUS5779 [Hexamita inflata]